MVKVICYNEEMTFESREDAMAYFYEGMCAVDPTSSEYERYAKIYTDLACGKKNVSDC